MNFNVMRRRCGAAVNELSSGYALLAQKLACRKSTVTYFVIYGRTVTESRLKGIKRMRSN